MIPVLIVRLSFDSDDIDWNFTVGCCWGGGEDRRATVVYISKD